MTETERTTSEAPRLCTQCAVRPPMFKLAEGSHFLCLDCYRTLAAVLDQQNAELERVMNYMGAQMEAAVGLPGLVPRFPERRPPINAQQLGGTVNNIQLNSSVVGAINTGTVEQLQASLTQISVGADQQLARELAKFVEAVAQADGLDDERKNEIAEQVEFLAEQVASMPETRKPSAVKAVMAAVKEAAMMVSGLGAAWGVVEPLLRAALGN